MDPSLQSPWMHPAGRRPGPPPWQRAVRIVLTFMIGAVLTGVAVTYLLPILEKHRKLRDGEAVVAAQLEAMRRLQADEENKLRWLRNDDEYLQIQARDKLDQQAPGEEIVRFRPPP